MLDKEQEYFGLTLPLTQRTKMKKANQTASKEDGGPCTVMINFTDRVYYAYARNGVRLAKVDFGKLIDQNDYGEPFAVSNNGLNFLFLEVELADSTLVRSIRLSILTLDARYHIERALALGKSTGEGGFIVVKDNIEALEILRSKSKNIPAHFRVTDFTCEINDRLDIAMSFYAQDPYSPAEI